MAGVAELVLLRRQLEPAESEATATAAAQQLAAGRSPQELAAILASLSRGWAWDDVMAWVATARADLTEPAYQRALGLFTDSALLSWSECAGVANALIYRGWPPANRQEHHPTEHLVDLVAVEALP